MTSTTSLAVRLEPLRQALYQRWQALDQRNQRALSVLAGALLLTIVWLVFWQPVQQRVQKLTQRVQMQRSNGEQVLGLLEQAKTLQGQATPVSVPAAATARSPEWQNLSAASLGQLLKAGQLRGAEVRALTQGAQRGWQIDLPQASFNQLFSWLQLAAANGWQATLLEAERIGTGDQVRVRLQLGQTPAAR
ncbi:type II secretion system protein GspM [Parvibium lacunae]|uniref:Type II secretion system protein M n=1 Tax=Parvibium lacunae TaxID=1888893 RepID=A0A368L0J6_9BURK|nr:type II secretion system protein GspM [Parvibium lacunae]RCS56811.1 hypothetical protein DU000_10750 [Parvibium lacunae]